ncbi:TPA: hypothetical protein ACPWS4_003959 [Pseudomonas aeruginosa]
MSTTRTPKKSLSERIVDAEVLGGRWLADGNEAAERGDEAKAKRCYEKAQFWLDRFNLLSGRGEKAPPKH